MANESAIAFVSNRGPVSFVEKDGNFLTRRGAGGLATALDPVARRIGDQAVWIAAATSDTDRRALHQGAIDSLTSKLGYRVHLLDIDPVTYSRYYDEVSNRLLWFANHGLWDEVEVEGLENALKAWDEAYEPVNERFAAAVREEVGANSLVLFQDYHLTTAPNYLRSQRNDATILHFTHSSFARPEQGLGRLPARISERVIGGMLASDLVGLHVPRWCANFAAGCESIGATVDRARGSVSHDGVTSWIRAYPIPIDAQGLAKRAAGEEARSWANRFRDWIGDGRLIARIDRSEPSKNIVRGFEAFGMLLDRRADLQNEVRFAACIYPSRQSMIEYRSYSEQIEAAAADVNQRHPDSIKLYTRDDFQRSLGALLAYDVLLVNPIMDGMNLVSKEGPAINQHDGVLVLSTGAGSFEELGSGSVPIEDPLDVEATSLALERALEIPEPERSERAQSLREWATRTRPEDWIEAQLSDLRAVVDSGEPLSSAPSL